ncbi:MAG TPA: biopolymer transporter ExbD [Desulfobulbus sp.]|nr:biopolymer transporter ExbD [Desulfobulbus sp.]
MKIKQASITPPRIEMLPLIDVVFLLLVFFIYAMLSMAVHHGLPVDLPKSGSVALENKQAIAITIEPGTGNALIFLDRQQVTPEQLTAALHSRAGTKSEREQQEVRIYADKSIAYQKLFQVLDCVRQAGMTRISLQAQQEQGSH